MKTRFLYPLLFLLPATTILPAQSVNPAAEILEQIILDSAMHQEEDANGWDEEFRTSEQGEQNGTMYDYQTNHGMPAGKRIGCICMDNLEMEEVGMGACAGHGGVRFWLYELADGTVQQYATRRHRAHPDNLSEEELANLSANQPKDKVYGKSSTQNQIFWFATVALICVTVMYVAKLALGKEEDPLI